MSRLLEQMGYQGENNKCNPITAMSEQALLLSDIMMDAINDSINEDIINRAFAEGYDPFAEGMFSGVNSVAADVKRGMSNGMNMIKELFKKAIQMIKNILRDFLNQEKQLYKLIQDMKNALRDRTRNVKDPRRNMKIITYESLAEASIPINGAPPKSYTEAILFICGLLDQASAGAQGQDTSQGAKQLSQKRSVQQVIQDWLHNWFESVKRLAKPWKKQTQQGGSQNQYDFAHAEKTVTKLIEMQVRGEESQTNKEWMQFLNEMAKAVDSHAKSYMDVTPDAIGSLARMLAAYGLQSDTFNDKKDSKVQVQDFNAVQLEKKNVDANTAYEVTRGLLNDFIDLYVNLNRRKLSRNFKNKEMKLQQMMTKLDRLVDRKNDGNTQRNFNQSGTSLVDQGKSMTEKSLGAGSSYNEIMREVHDYMSEAFGEGLFGNNNGTQNYNTDNGNTNNNSTPNNANANNNEYGGTDNTAGNDPSNTGNLVPYVKAYVVNFSQGTMHCAMFYNAVLKKWNYAVKETLVAYYALTTGSKDNNKTDNVQVPNNNKGNNNNQGNNEEIPTGKL